MNSATDFGHEPTEFSKDEIELYEALGRIVKKVTSKGTFELADVDLSKKDDIGEKELSTVFDEFLNSDKFSNALKRRFEENDPDILQPLKSINLGFFKLLDIDFWKSFKKDNTFENDLVFYYCTRMPDSGIPTTTNLPLRREDGTNPQVREIKHIEFIEFPGRLEILSDFVPYIMPDQSRKKTIIFFFVSLYNLDNLVVDENGAEVLEFDQTLKVMKLMNKAARNLPVVIHFTMNTAAEEKWKYFKEAGIIEEKLKLLQIQDQVEGDVWNDSYSIALKKMCKDKIAQVFTSENILKTFRASNFKFDDKDRESLYMALREAGK